MEAPRDPGAVALVRHTGSLGARTPTTTVVEDQNIGAGPVCSDRMQRRLTKGIDTQVSSIPSRSEQAVVGCRPLAHLFHRSELLGI